MDEKENKIGELAALAVNYRDEAEHFEGRAKAAKFEMQLALDKIFKHMDAEGMQSFKACGNTFYIEDRESVSVPKSAEHKKQLFGYLESLGILDDYLTINSASLNSLYKSLSDAALEKGDIDFRLPGVGEPSSFKKVKIRRS